LLLIKIFSLAEMIAEIDGFEVFSFRHRASRFAAAGATPIDDSRRRQITTPLLPPPCRHAATPSQPPPRFLPLSAPGCCRVSSLPPYFIFAPLLPE
jgi:hypothetical protein